MHTLCTATLDSALGKHTPYDYLSCLKAIYCLQKQQRALPHLTEPHDSLRLGVQTLKDKASVNHPVEAIEEQVAFL